MVHVWHIDLFKEVKHCIKKIEFIKKKKDWLKVNDLCNAWFSQLPL